MSLTLQLKAGFSNAALWLSAHPTVVRLTLIALAAALLAYSPAYACPAGSSGSGCH